MRSVLARAEDPLATAVMLGFEGIEIELAREQLRSSDTKQVERLRDAARSRSLEIHALVLGEHNHGGIAASDPHTAERAAEEVELALGWAAELGADVVLVPFFLEAELRSDGDFDRCANAFAALCPLAAEGGVTLCYEGLLPADRIRELAQRVASPAFGCYFDLANPLRRGLDPPTEIRELRELVRRVHVKETLVRPGDVRPGRGRVDFAECALALEEIGYDGWLTLETPPGPPPLVARDLSFARSAFPTLGGDPTWPRFGAFSYDFTRGQWRELATAFGRLGLGAVQLGSELLDECLDDGEAATRGRATLEEQGLQIVALAGYRNLVAPDPIVREANIGHIARCLAVAPALGTHVVATETGTRDPTGDWTDSPDNWGDEAWRLLDDALERLLPVAERSGTILALEATVKNVLKTQSQLVGLLERFPTEQLQVVCDPYNYVSRHLVPAHRRATAELLERFEDRFVVAHLKDVAAGGAEDATPELGTGVFDQLPYLEFLRDRRPDLDLIVEHLPLEHVPAALERVRMLVEA
jgi:sugar phosphate isomerase/epimerase